MTSIDPDSAAIDDIAIDLSVMFICKGLIQLVTSCSQAQKAMFEPKSRGYRQAVDSVAEVLQRLSASQLKVPALRIER